MKLFPILLLTLVLTGGAFAQQQTGNLPAFPRQEFATYKTSTIEQTATSEVATPAAMDTTKNLDTLVFSSNLIYHGPSFTFRAHFANSTDTFKVQQYNLNGDRWETLPVNYIKQNPRTYTTPAYDTTVTRGVVSPVGTNLNTNVSFDFTVPNLTNGDMRILRGAQDTGKVKITYVIKQ